MTSENILNIGRKNKFPEENTPLIVKPFLFFDQVWIGLKLLFQNLSKTRKSNPAIIQTICTCPALLKKAAFPERFATLEQVLVKPKFRSYVYQTTIGNEVDKLEVKDGSFLHLTKLESYQMN
jgi:hypothetical protein